MRKQLKTFKMISKLHSSLQQQKAKFVIVWVNSSRHIFSHNECRFTKRAASLHAVMLSSELPGYLLVVVVLLALLHPVQRSRRRVGSPTEGLHLCHGCSNTRLRRAAKQTLFSTEYST